jgi:hypothetical protein
LKKNSVGTKQLRNSAVKEKKLAANAVTTIKIADNAVNGAKVDEASLGQVPSAATAGTANSANSAESANTAQSAGTADSAADAEALEGRALGAVRSLAVGATDSTSQGLDDTNYEDVMSASIAIPTGGADLMVTATAELVNNGGGQAGAQCRLASDSVLISQTNTVTMPSGHSKVVSLVGFANDLPSTGIGDPENIDVECQGSIADDTVQFSNGDLVAQRIPVGTGS